MSQYRECSDEELFQLMQGGDHGAFEVIYHRYKATLYLHAYRKLESEEEADDLVHDLFAALWAKREDIELRESLSAYLYRAIKNRILDRVSHQMVVGKYEQSFSQFIRTGPVMPDQFVRERELRRIIEVETENLPPKMQEIFQMSRFRQLSHREIAKQMAVSEKTVKNQVNNALKILKRKLGPLLILLFML